MPVTNGSTERGESCGAREFVLAFDTSLSELARSQIERAGKMRASERGIRGGGGV